MRQEITLRRFAVDPDSGSVEVEVIWNGQLASTVYTSVSQFQTANADIMVAPDEAIRWLLYYLLSLGHTAETLPAQQGRTLVVDIAPAVQQTISLI